MQASRTTLIHELLSPELIRVGLPGGDKQAVIDGLVDVLEGHPAVRDLEELRHAVFQREEVMSTGVGKQLALPHAKTSAVSETVGAFAVTQEPVPFDAIDDEPVRLVFLLVGTEEARSLHIKILSRISRLMNRADMRGQLLEAKTPDQVLGIFENGDGDAAGS